DPAAFGDGFDGVLDDLDERLLDFAFVELDRIEVILELQLPLELGIVLGLLKAIGNLAQDGIEVAGGMGGGVFFLAAEGSQVLSYLGGLASGLLDLQKRTPKGAGWFELGQDKGGMPQDAGENVVEVERDGAGELQCAIELLFLKHRRIARATLLEHCRI